MKKDLTISVPEQILETVNCTKDIERQNNERICLY